MRLLRRLLGDTRGNVVTTFALATPVIAILTDGVDPQAMRTRLGGAGAFPPTTYFEWQLTHAS